MPPSLPRNEKPACPLAQPAAISPAFPNFPARGLTSINARPMQAIRNGAFFPQSPETKRDISRSTEQGQPLFIHVSPPTRSGGGKWGKWGRTPPLRDERGGQSEREVGKGEKESGSRGERAATRSKTGKGKRGNRDT